MATTQPVQPVAHLLSAVLIWQMRCRTLAEAHNLAATLQGRSVRGVYLYSVPSTSRPGSAHVVRYHADGQPIECDCIAAYHGQACGHVGAVLIAVDRAEQAERARQAAAQQSEAMRWWLNGGESW